MEITPPTHTFAFKPCRLAAILFAFAALLLPALPARAANYYIMLQTNLYGNLDQHDMSIYPTMACGPASTANAFKYLQSFNPTAYSSLVPGSGYSGLVSLGDTLAGATYMNTDGTDGTWHDNLIMGAVSYIETNAPSLTTYSAQDYWSWSHQDQPSWATTITPRWNFLYQGLVAQDAIEILLTYNAGGGHFVTPNGFSWNDVNDDGIIQSGENAQLYFMNPWTGSETNAHIWQTNLNTRLETDYSSSYISTIFEVTVPEPSAAWLLAASVPALLWFRRRKR